MQYSKEDLVAVPGSEKVSDRFKEKLIKIAKDLNANPNYLMAVICFETGGTFSPSIKNPYSGATGLIQFMPKTAKSLGTSTEKLAKMSAEEQLDYVAKYLQPYKNKLNTIEDTYMAVFTPAGIGKGNDSVLYRKGTIAYKQNKGLDDNKDGKITVGEAAQKVKEKLEIGQKQPTISSQVRGQVITNAARTIIQELGKPEENGNIAYRGSTYNMTQSGDKLSVSTADRGEILSLERDKIINNKTNSTDLTSLSRVVYQNNFQQDISISNHLDTNLKAAIAANAAITILAQNIHIVKFDKEHKHLDSDLYYYKIKQDGNSLTIYTGNDVNNSQNILLEIADGRVNINKLNGEDLKNIVRSADSLFLNSTEQNHIGDASGTVRDRFAQNYANLYAEVSAATSAILSVTEQLKLIVEQFSGRSQPEEEYNNNLGNIELEP